MTTSNDFHFALLRISTAQLLRTVGIDRCAPSVLDTVTDIFLRHLNLLAITSQKLATLSGRKEVGVEDLAEAMVQIGVVKPAQYLDTSNYETDLLMALGGNDDEYDENDDDDEKKDYEENEPFDHDNNPDSDRAREEHDAFRKHKITGLEVDGFHNFVDWAKGPVTQDARFISHVVIPSQGPSLNVTINPLLSTAGAASTTTTTITTAANSSSAVATSITGSLSTFVSNQIDAKSDDADQSAQSQPIRLQQPDPPIKTEEWLQHLMKKQVKVGYEKRFQATILASSSSSNDCNDDEDVINEYKISGGPATLEEAFRTLSQR
ncbi:hypothetical protein D0Z03_000739 [Geotrichum reessii]|nr:hypothetical protein D0Z03_000739 [Galactomyces reessii]